MIAVCELQCKGLSHEKVNSGFIYALSIAFPGEKILFYADHTHIEAIKYILKYKSIIHKSTTYIIFIIRRGLITNIQK